MTSGEGPTALGRPLSLLAAHTVHSTKEVGNGGRGCVSPTRCILPQPAMLAGRYGARNQTERGEASSAHIPSSGALPLALVGHSPVENLRALLQ